MKDTERDGMINEETKESQDIQTDTVEVRTPSNEEMPVEEPPSVDLAVDALGLLSYPLLQARVPIIANIEITNNTEDDIDSLRVVFSTQFEYFSVQDETVHIKGGATFSLQPTIKVEGKTLLKLSEAVEETLMISIKISDGESLITKQIPFKIQPMNQWSGYHILPETLATFVMPNLPAIHALQRRAAELLKKVTGQSAMAGYAADDKNVVRQQMAAIYAAIYEQNIAYVLPPSSFEVAQRVRTTEEILTYKSGTCIEMAVLYCALAEACGLNPFLILVPGHAFTGVWLKDEMFSENAVYDKAELDKRVAKGINDIEVLECTGMNSESGISFEKAVGIGRDKLQESFNLALDVRRIHYTLLRPLPVLMERDGQEVICDYGIAEDAQEMGDTIRNIDEIDFNINRDIRVDKKAIWMRNLLDLSKRNGLISFKLGKNAVQLVGREAASLEDVLSDGKTLDIREVMAEWHGVKTKNVIVDVESEDEFISRISKADYKAGQVHTYLDKNKLATVLTDIYRTAKSNLEETGANSLYLALGFLRWFDMTDAPDADGNIQARYAPLVLLPLELIRAGRNQYKMRLREEDPQFNITLIEKLRRDYDIRLEGLNPLPTDQSGADLPLVFNLVRKAVMNLPGWDVIEISFIGNFSFSQFVMWNDLNLRFDKLTENKVVKALVEGRFRDYNENETNIEELDDRYKVADLAIPGSIDSSQLVAVIEAAKGNSFVLHGPPGTGKSQTITNMIANSLYQGKKVLFVAEKMAALNVVSERLQKLGLGDFCAEIYSNKTKKQTFLNKIQSVMALKAESETEAYARKTARLQSIKDDMNAVLQAIHTVRPQGYSLYQCLGECMLNFPDDYYAFTDEQVSVLNPSDIETGIRLVEEAARLKSELRYTMNEHPLREFCRVNYTLSAKDEVKTLIGQLMVYINKLQGLRQSLDETSYHTALSEADFSVIIEMDRLKNERNMKTVLTKDLWNLLQDSDIQEKLLQVIDFGKKAFEHEQKIKEYYTSGIKDFNVQDTRLKLTVARGKLFFKSKKVKEVLAPLNALKIDTIPITDEMAEAALADIALYQEEMQRLQQDLSDVLNILKQSINVGLSPIDALEDVYVFVTKILSFGKQCGMDGDKLFSLYEIEQKYNLSAENDVQILRETAEMLKQLSEDFNKLTGVEMKVELFSNDTYAQETVENLKRWQANLDLWRNLTIFRESVNRVRNIGWDLVAEDLDNSTDTDVNSYIKRTRSGLMYGMIRYFTKQSPSLDRFNHIVEERKLDEYNRLIKDMEDLSREHIKAALVAQIPNIRTGTDKEARQMADLSRMIQSKGRGVSIRDMFNDNADVLPRLLPCMLMSPLSVAQYINLDFPKFDMVIFDEASQIRTGMAVGAMSRAKDCIIVGDPKQMPPTSFFNSQNLDEDNLHVEDLESLLEDCLAVNMPQYYLNCHYRSQSESLITFSNSNFYQNKMLTFPAPTDIVSKVSLHTVDGTYDRGNTRTNEAEADAIIKAVAERLRHGLKDTIGIITFNATQQNLIDDKLQLLLEQDKALTEAAGKLKEDIFIKNLENVQGDERDVIYFSVTYGPDESGKVYQNFGPLGKTGGWRRLNVAVTRARKEMHVFSTMTSSDIVVSSRTKEGVRSLKAFLDFAATGRVPGGAGGSIQKQSQKDSFLMSIRIFLEKHGYKTVTHVGTSKMKIPLAVVDPGDPDKYICALLIDDAEYTNLPTMRDRAHLIPSVLKHNGWNLYRIWALDWFMTREKEEQRLLAYLQNELHAYGQKKENLDSALGDNIDNNTDAVKGNIREDIERYADPVVSEEKTVHCVPKEFIDGFEGAKSRAGDGIDSFIGKEYEVYIGDKLSPTTALQEARTPIAELAEAIVAVEAPITENLLMHRICEIYSGVKLTANAREYISSALKRVNLHKKVHAKSIVYWGDLDSNNYRIYRTPTASVRRDLADIPVIELANALYTVALNAADETGIIRAGEDEICRSTVRLFGYNRMTEGMKKICKNAITDCIRHKRLKRDGTLLAIVCE